ncbi:F-box-like domain-containing protein [Purpureocillium lavendulum]|uniref:F-box-like domain-containing protein n=1 Tax=Purpureocillium lavendulum TaxID=1247861 RepID=A0AB34FMI3_9HYPO|nr:F-box-like domain-containing protein [Purpureocillium lavendulum]
MDALPPELLCEIFANLPPTSRKNARLASRRFNAILAREPSMFRTLSSFIDPDVALATLESAASDLSRRPRSIWSPRCCVPADLPVPRSFLLAVYLAVTGRPWEQPRPLSGSLPPRQLGDKGWGESESSEEESVDGSEVSMASGDEWCPLSLCNLGKTLDREDITEDTLRQAMFRYALYLSYNYDGAGEAPQLWVCDATMWVGRV